MFSRAFFKKRRILACVDCVKICTAEIFDPENEDNTEEIMKMLESSDIECSSDDDDPDWELPECQVVAIDDDEEQSQEDFNDAADTSVAPGKYIWKKQPFKESRSHPASTIAVSC